MVRESTIIYKSFYEAIKTLPETNQVEVWKAICEFSFFGKEIELSELSLGFWFLIKPQLVANNQRFKNGKKGGRPHNQTITEPKPSNNQTETKPKPNNNVNVNVNDNPNVNENNNNNKINEPSGENPDLSSSSFDSNNEQGKKENVPPKEKSQFTSCIEIYSEFHLKQLGVPIKMDGGDGKAMKTILAYLETAIKGKQTTVEKSWKFILDNFSKWDKFYQGQLTIKQINSNLINILNSIKNYGKGNSKVTTAGLNELLYKKHGDKAVFIKD